jgi:hypothetical protein
MVLLAEPEFALPFVSDPRGVSRKFKLFRQFRIEGKPQPEEVRAVPPRSEKSARIQVATLLPRRAPRQRKPKNSNERTLRLQPTPG